MYSTTILLGVLATLALVQGIAIDKDSNTSSTTDVTATSNVNPNNGIAVQTGYEGYIVTPAGSDSRVVNRKQQILFNHFLKPASKYLARYGLKALTLATPFIITLVLGIAMITAICSFTSLCTFSLAMPDFGIFKGESLKDKIASLAEPYRSLQELIDLKPFVRKLLEEELPKTAGYFVDPRQANVADNEASS